MVPGIPKGVLRMWCAGLGTRTPRKGRWDGEPRLTRLTRPRSTKAGERRGLPCPRFARGRTDAKGRKNRGRGLGRWAQR